MSDGAVWINGEFTSREDARISAFDASVQHGVGLFETMYARLSHVWRLDDHTATNDLVMELFQFPGALAHGGLERG